MNFENWVCGSYTNESLNGAIARQGSTQNLRKMHKALAMADSMLADEAVTALAVGKFASFGDSLLVVTTKRVLIIKNSFQSGFAVSLDLDVLESAHFSFVPLLGYSLALQGGVYRISRIPAAFVAHMQDAVAAESVPQFASVA